MVNWPNFTANQAKIVKSATHKQFRIKEDNMRDKNI